ncbi:polyisoprenoid-binding protein [bacterium]|nr:polyisoprenoid-binding protein [bacterium]
MLRKTSFALALVATPAFASTWTVDPVHSNIGFTVRHLVTKVNGSFNEFEGNVQFDDKKPEASKVNVTVKTESIFTANQQRDEHLRSADFFDTKKFPTATFESGKVAALGKGQFKIDGTLSLHGVTKPVTLEVEYLGTAKDMYGNTRGGFTAKTKISRKEFGLTWNKLTEAGNVVVGDDVEMNLNIAAIEVKPQEAKKETKPK